MTGSSANESRGESSSPADPTLLSQSYDSEQNDPELSSVDPMWEQKWTKDWEQQQHIQQQHIQATGEQLVATPSELKKLKQKGVPSNISTTLIETTPEFFPNIFSLLTTLAVLPVTSCEAERCISCLPRLKTYLRSSMGQDRLI